jgi:hypothetical protein
MNPFKTSDLVKTTSGSRVAGKVKYIACKGATTAGGKTCDKKACNCFIKDYVWVEWTDSKVFSYEHTELAFDVINGGSPIVSNVLEEKKPDTTIPDLTTEKFNYDLYNGITEVRYTRDGKGYLVNVVQEIPKPAIEEKELDFDVYNGKGIVRKKK